MATTTQGADTARETGMQAQTQAKSAEELEKSMAAAESVAELLAATMDLVGLVTTKHPQRPEWTQRVRDAIARAKGEPVTRICDDCGEATALDDLTDDGRCERCATACVCATCGDTFPLDEITDVDGDELCAACVEARDDDDGDQCGACAGTGIGQHGDPDTSSCHACSGRAERDPGEAFDHWRDAQREL